MPDATPMPGAPDPDSDALDAVIVEVRQHANGIGVRTLINLLEQRGPHSRSALRDAVQDGLDECDLGLNSQLRLVIPKERPYGPFF